MVGSKKITLYGEVNGVRRFFIRLLLSPKGVTDPKRHRARTGARIANAVLYFGTHMEPTASQAYVLFLLSH